MENELTDKELDELDQWMKDTIEEARHWTLEQTTDNFTCYPLWWNDAICFLQNPIMCAPGILLCEDDCLFYDYAPPDYKEQSSFDVDY